MLNAVFRASYVDRARFAPAPVAWRDWLRPGRPRLWWNQRVARHLDYRGRLGEVRAPTLVLAGRHDPQMPPACGEELARGIPGARLVVFERSGHYPFIEEQGAFWAAIGGFLAGGRADEPGRPPPVAGGDR
jgi:pimeloyl-ACP methyl ester carboxylesterase